MSYRAVFCCDDLEEYRVFANVPRLVQRCHPLLFSNASVTRLFNASDLNKVNREVML